MRNWLLFGALSLALFCPARADSVFIAVSPTEFSEGFNRASRLLRLKPRMPIWPARSGKFSAVVSPGVTVFATGVLQGDGVSQVTVQCKTPDRCHEAIAASALSADPQINISALQSYLDRKWKGQYEDGAVMTQAGLMYSTSFNKKNKTITFNIHAAPDED